MLPARMDSPEARAMLLAIGLQESGLKHRLQIGGPAHGYLQFERSGGCFGVLRHPATAALAKECCVRLDIIPESGEVYHAIVFNDVLACAFGRLLLWTSPEPLPLAHEPSYGWDMYRDCWRPGKPHPATWAGHFASAWKVVNAKE
jgi:hypothetical protein